MEKLDFIWEDAKTVSCAPKANNPGRWPTPPEPLKNSVFMAAQSEGWEGRVWGHGRTRHVHCQCAEDLSPPVFSNFSAHKISQALLPLQPKGNHSSPSSFRASKRRCNNISAVSTLWAYFLWACSTIRRTGINPPYAGWCQGCQENDANVSLQKLSAFIWFSCF